MKATYKPNAKTKFTTSHRKENAGLHKEYTMIVPRSGRCPDGPEAHAVVTLRLYWPGTVCYACLWIHADNLHTSGSGRAGGGGYCKASAAAAEAIRNAGFELGSSISGVGHPAIREAMRAIAAAVGHPDAMLHESHP